MTQKAVIFILAPVLILAATWQHLASRLNKNTDKPVVTFEQARNDAFGIVTKPNCINATLPDATPSRAWREVEISRYFAKEKKRLGQVITRGSVEASWRRRDQR